MTNPKITRRQIIKGGAAVAAIGAWGLPSAAFADEGNGGEGDRRIRWDLIDLTFPDIRAGGEDTASSEGETTLNLFGSGTFRPGHPRDVTGGGNWNTDNPVVRGSGTYRVTELIGWLRAPGTLAGTPLRDHIGRLVDTRAGLAVLRIRYSDGLVGVLFLSCNLNGTPPSVNEGINGSRGFVNFFEPAKPAFGNHSNRTLFHAIGEEEAG
jgi:hypothetical protein